MGNNKRSTKKQEQLRTNQEQRRKAIKSLRNNKKSLGQIERDKKWTTYEKTKKTKKRQGQPAKSQTNMGTTKITQGKTITNLRRNKKQQRNTKK